MSIGYVVALIFGIVAVVEANGRSWAGWGVIALAAVLLYSVVK
jgi:hypothetical protein